MSLSLLVPAFLIGLAALAIPVIIHLTRRQSKESIDFPSLMFVQQIPHRSTQRRSIRNWPLFLLRCLAIALITLAFARPLFDREEAAAATAGTAGARELVVLLDRSHSMGLGGRLERAKQAAMEQFDGLGPADRGTLVLFDSGAEALVESTPDRARLRSAVGMVETTARSTRYAPAFRYAERVLATSTHPRKEVVVISDFQRHGWDADQGEAASIRLPVGTVITPVEISDEAASNVVIASVSFRRTSAAGAERAIATARLVNQGSDIRAALPVSLELAGRTVETRSVRLEAGGTATVEFAPVTLPAEGVTRGVIRAAGDPTPDAAPAVHHFVLSPDQRIGVVVVDGGGRAAYFLERVLAIGDAPGFRTVMRPGNGLRAVDIAQARVVVLNQTPLPGGEVGARLRTFVENGGGVVMLMGDHRTGGWEGAFADRPGRAVDHTATGGVALGFIDFGHPTFEPFSAPRSGDFTAPRFLRYRAVPETTDERVLARFSDGGAALTERRIGKGRILVWGSTPDDQWNDLAVQPVFLPFVHQLVKYASGYSPAQPAFTVGDPFDPGSAAGERFTMAVTPSGERMEIGERGPLTLDEAGFYEMRHGRSGELALSIAVNVDPAESDPARVAPEELVSAFVASSQSGTGAERVPLTVQEREREQGAWWYLVVVGFVLLAGETVLSNWRRTPSPVA